MVVTRSQADRTDAQERLHELETRSEPPSTEPADTASTITAAVQRSNLAGLSAPTEPPGVEVDPTALIVDPQLWRAELDRHLNVSRGDKAPTLVPVPGRDGLGRYECSVASVHKAPAHVPVPGRDGLGRYVRQAADAAPAHVPVPGRDGLGRYVRQAANAAPTYDPVLGRDGLGHYVRSVAGGDDSAQVPDTVLRDDYNRYGYLDAATSNQPEPNAPEPGRSATQRDTNAQSRTCLNKTVVFRQSPAASRCSNNTAMLMRQAEYEAEQKMLEINRRELQLERQMIKNKLASRLDAIEAEGSQRGSVLGQPEFENQVDSWLEQCALPANPSNPNRTSNLHESTPQHEPRPSTQTPSRERSNSGNRGIAQLAEAIEKMSRQRPPPRQVYELPTFSGTTGEWLPFQAAYAESTRAYSFKSTENMARLRSCLKGAAREAVLALLHTTTDPEHVMQTLRQCYGRPEIIVDRALEDLRRLPRLGSSASDLNAFAVKVQNIITVVASVDKRKYLYNPLLTREILDRLSPHLRSRFCDYAELNMDTDDPEVVVLTKFLMREADRALRFTYSMAPTGTSTAVAPPPNRRELRPVKPIAIRRPNPVYSAEQIESCLSCGGTHETTQCKKLQALTVAARWGWAKENRVCFKCLSKRHRREQCRAKGCSITGCPHSHHHLLHVNEPNLTSAPRTQAPAPRSPAQVPRTQAPAPRTQAPAPQATQAPQEPEAPEFVTNTTNSAAGAPTVLLKVVPVTLYGPKGRVESYALLDEGSTVSLIDHDLALEIGATGPEAPLYIKGVGDMTQKQNSRRIEADICGRNEGRMHRLKLQTVRGLNLHNQAVSKNLLKNHAHLTGLDGACYNTAAPRLLIGADHWHIMVAKEIRTGRANEPAAVLTDLGWAIYGTAPRAIKAQGYQTALHLSIKQDEIHDLVERHFAVDSLGVALKTKVRPLDERATRIFNETVRKIEGRYEVGQLWRDDEPKLPPNFQMAYNRLLGVERKMDKDPNFKREYTQQIENLLAKDYAAEITDPEASPYKYYLPHFAVRNPNKPGKIRLVFDAAATCRGVSLNDQILEGPDLLQSLPGILFRFREGAYAVSADVQEMFLQIRIRPADQPSQLFLWRGDERSGQPRTFAMKSMIFGAASSPFLAHSVRNKNALDNAEEHPDAVYDITCNHYMDDLVASYATESELIHRSTEIAASHKKGGFNLRGWTSNSRELIHRIPPELRTEGPTPLGDKTPKVLGLYWEPNKDVLGFNTALMRVPAEVKERKRGPTKREALSAVMSIYDPLGLISQYAITAKVQLQRLWALKMGWDEPLPEDERDIFSRWLGAMNSVAALRIPRNYFKTGGEARPQLHIFVDASEQAYAAAAYWRTNGSNPVVGLITARAKVAPMKRLSIPRLELQAAVIGARLSEVILKEHRYAVGDVTFWTDSRTVLHWVRDDAHRYSPFVAHRLGEIAEKTKAEQWRWVPTKENPADDATRADCDRAININDRWYTGPAFLRRPEEDWPREPARQEEPEPSTCAHTASQPREHSLPEISRFSNYKRLIRATAYVLLFIERCRKESNIMLPRHLERAELLWQQKSQADDFPDEIKVLEHGGRVSKKSKLYALDPVLENGIIKMHGRINAAPVRITKNPVILNGRHPLVRLMILQAHCDAAHSSHERVVNDLRQHFWILHLRPTVRSVAHNCRTCLIHRAHPQAPAMGDLPVARLEPHRRAFTNCGVDYFGPLTVTIGRRHEKRWVALFTCLTTRAVHLELAASLTTDSAIMALRRMAARRGWPKLIYSDNGTNFRGADVELQAAYQEWLPALREYALQRRTEWRFIPPGAPNQGGAWERLVRSVKTALTVTLKTKAPKEEVLATLLAEAENTINSRPLTHVSTDPRDDEALTPNHFLLGSSTGLPATGPCEEGDRRTWRASQALADHFWSRWVREYLPTLAPRRSPSGGERPLQVGDLVVVVDSTLPRNVWPRGVVIETYPGADGGIRSARVRTKGGEFRRPTSKLAVLPVKQDGCD